MLQAVINSTITPNMTFTQTSQKFGQWSDVRANTVYGAISFDISEKSTITNSFQVWGLQVKRSWENLLKSFMKSRKRQKMPWPKQVRMEALQLHQLRLQMHRRLLLGPQSLKMTASYQTLLIHHSQLLDQL